MTFSSPDIEKRELAREYRRLLRAADQSKGKEDRKRIRKAWELAVEAHKDMRRRSGEAYIFHPIAVARICAEEIGLDTTSIVCALLHDTVEDTWVTLDDIERMFGKRERAIIDGLTKISGIFDPAQSAQAENFRKMLLTLSDDIRVIIIKIADRLHNMRTLDSMKREKQLKIAGETDFMYAPLAHRLGLYTIKSELEDLSLRYRQPEEYAEIEQKLRKTKAVRTRFINSFAAPIKGALTKEGLKFAIKGRPKSIASIWNKMQKQKVSFEDIYDIFAIRIILDTSREQEKSDAWRTYSVVTDFYPPNPDRLRDWISIPKANGYESLHTTVMSPTGKWVEVQIRSERMDEIAEKGYAAHWRYKGQQGDSRLDEWIGQIREVIEGGEDSALEFVDELKLDLFNEEVYVFTPNGDLIVIGKGATALDFAFRVHSQVGQKCIGAKVNKKLVPIGHVLQSGDQVEILTSRKQKPKEDWVNMVATASARSKIRASLRADRQKMAAEGKEKLRKMFKKLHIDFIQGNIEELAHRMRVNSTTELFVRLADGRVTLDEFPAHEVRAGRLHFVRRPASVSEPESLTPTPAKSKTPEGALVLGMDKQSLDYSMAACCRPIPGDDVFGFVTVSGGIKVHRSACPNSTQLLSKYGYRVLKARWAGDEDREGAEAAKASATIAFAGVDDIGLVNHITGIISADMSVDMKKVSFETNEGSFEGRIEVVVNDTEHLGELIERLREVPGLSSVDRLED